MPNWCVNDVRFSGNEQAIENVTSLILKMSALEKATQNGQRPFFLKRDSERYFFEIKSWRDGNDYLLSYLTKWVPNASDVLRIGQKYNVSFVDAVEQNNGIYHRDLFCPGKIPLHSELELNELMSIDFDPQTDEYLFEGMRFEYVGNCVQFILDRKLLLLRNQFWK